MSGRGLITYFIFVLGLVGLLSGLPAVADAAESVSVQAQVDKQEVSVGESLLLQVKIDGDDSPVEPDLSGLADFTVQPLGGGQNNRESISIINGKVNRISEHGYVFRYTLTPQRDGLLTIPALAVTAAGKTLLTQPVNIKVEKPLQTDEFRLVQELSQTDCYVGQPLVYSVIWFVDRNIEEFSFNLPVLDDRRFETADFPEDRDYAGQDAIAVSLNGSRVIARRGQTAQYVTVTLRRILIPREPGTFALEPATVSSRVVTGYRQRRGGQSGSPFDNGFIDDMFNRRQPVFQQLLTVSAPLDLNVKPLPAEKRPQNFTGLVGIYSLAAEASPVEVNVGDPITLNIMVTGSEYLENVVLPPLAEQAGMENFKVPEEMGQGDIAGRIKTFTQTIRARNTAIQEIPGIELPFFNPETGRYDTARSNVVPLKVHLTKVITASDAEGGSAVDEKMVLTPLDQGIAHNYVGEDVLENQHFEAASLLGSAPGLILMILPPLAYLLVLSPVLYRRRRRRTGEALEARGALQVFLKELAEVEKDNSANTLQKNVGGFVEAVRAYLGKRLQLPPGSLIFADVARRLQQLGVDESLLLELKEILGWCEACHYGGIDLNGSGCSRFENMVHQAPDLFKKIDQYFKK